MYRVHSCTRAMSPELLLKLPGFKDALTIFDANEPMPIRKEPTMSCSMWLFLSEPELIQLSDLLSSILSFTGSMSWKSGEFFSMACFFTQIWNGLAYFILSHQTMSAGSRWLCMCFPKMEWQEEEIGFIWAVRKADMKPHFGLSQAA